MTSFDDLFSQVEDQPIPGGCDMCDAYQIVETVSPGVHVLNVHHDEECPILRASRSQAN
jgi:hypothetical protein